MKTEEGKAGVYEELAIFALLELFLGTAIATAGTGKYSQFCLAIEEAICSNLSQLLTDFDVAVKILTLSRSIVSVTLQSTSL